MSSRIRSSPNTGTDGRHRLGVGLAMAVGATLSAGVAAEALASPVLDGSASSVDLEPVAAEAITEQGDAVASALAEVDALQEALEQAPVADASRFHPDDPAMQDLNAPADRPVNPVVPTGEDAEVDDEPEPEPAPEPEPEPAPEPEPEPAPEPEPEPAPEVAADSVTTGASGVARSTWKALAGCESNGDWTIDTGNSFYGGLQFNLKSWNWAGGQRFAEYPHHATKDQQIAVAETLLDIHPAGWGAWPACSAKLGLR